MRGDERTVLVDASAFITLSEVDEVAALRGIQGELVIPVTVDQEIVDEPATSALEEAVAEAPRWVHVRSHPDEAHIDHAASHLGRDVDRENYNGDIMLLAHALATDQPVVVTDDKSLRRACKALSIPLTGSIGVLVRAVERGDLGAEDAKNTLYAMDEVGARLSASLVKRAETLIDEATAD